jgi:hypothetical protein
MRIVFRFVCFVVILGMAGLVALLLFFCAHDVFVSWMRAFLR